jgi:3D (Asp-Asp-Asp) domain-containing protein
LLKSWLLDIGQENPNLMKSSTFLGSAASVLLAFSAISYSKTFIQDPKAVQQPQNPNQPSSEPIGQTSAEPTKPQTKVAQVSATMDASKAPVSLTGTETAKSVVAANVDTTRPKATANVAASSLTYTATAYSLRGRTASGKLVSRGLIAADPLVLPLGSRVRVEAGSFSGEYVVGDTGGGVRGRHIDIWTPSAREARQFGRRAVKLTVLTLGARREIRPRIRRKH